MSKKSSDGEKVYVATILIYFGFRILGAKPAHAWQRALTAMGRAVIDKTVDLTGIRHPDGIPDGQMQITFEGGPADREVRNVEICGTVDLLSDGKTHRYIRTERRRGYSIIFTLASA